MIWKKLPKSLVETVINTKHNSSTIQIDIYDALERSKDVEEFKRLAINSMIDLITECKTIINQINKG